MILYCSLVLLFVALALFWTGYLQNGKGPEAGCFGLGCYIAGAVLLLVSLLLQAIWLGTLIGD